MKFFTSYFYKIRFFKPYQIPISTAISDPKWYHDFKDQSHKFLDKRNVINGLRCEFLKPGEACHNLCSGKPCQYSPETCEFLKTYRKQIFALDKDFVLCKFKKLENIIKFKLKINEELEFILMVHEAITNKCSERKILQDYFQCNELI
jgi:hypothetical protein